MAPLGRSRNGSIVVIINTWSDTFTDLAKGTAASWAVPIMIDLGFTTTITWTATVEAADDVNALNNTVTVDMQVRLTGGGGSH